MHTKQSPQKKAPVRRTKRREMNRYSKTVIRWLVFCFPAGLLMMWGDRCKWARSVKSAISAGFACLLIALILPQTLPPERAKGGVQMVSLSAASEVQGPVQQDVGEDFEIYIPTYVKPASVVIAPTPTPLPIYVYCNDGGKYYHSKKCRYVKDTSSRVTLTQAINVGYARCKDCDAPEEYEEILYG